MIPKFPTRFARLLSSFLRQMVLAPAEPSHVSHYLRVFCTLEKRKKGTSRARENDKAELFILHSGPGNARMQIEWP